MPRCAQEWDDAKPATLKKYVPTLQANGVSVVSELQEVTTTRRGLMEHGAPPPSYCDSPPCWYMEYMKLFPVSSELPCSATACHILG